MFHILTILLNGEKKKKKKSSVEWFRPVLPVKKAQEKKIWRGECSNVPKKSKSGVGKKKSCVPCACGASMYPTNVDHQQNIFKIGNPSGEPATNTKKKKKKENEINYDLTLSGPDPYIYVFFFFFLFTTLSKSTRETIIRSIHALMDSGAFPS